MEILRYTVTVHQGVDMGRPSVPTIGIPARPGTGIDVTGGAVGRATTPL